MKLRLFFSSLAIVSALSACGGGGGEGSTPLPAQAGSINGTATKGPVANATVTAYALANGMQGAQIASTTTDGAGNFTLAMGSYAGAVMLQMSGGSYTDEATGTTMPMAAGDAMTAMLPTMAAGATVAGVQITPLTAMAQTMAQHMAGGMTDANIAAAHNAVGGYFMVGDILHSRPMNPLTAGASAGATQDMMNYGMTLAALSQLAQAQGMSTSSAMVTAMMNDAADGTLDGRANGTSVMMGGMGAGMMSRAMPTTAGTTDLASAMSAFMASAQNKSGVAAASMQTLMSKMMGSDGRMMGSSPATGTGATVGGTAFFGKVGQGTVSAYAMTNGAMGAQLASTATDGTGAFTLSLGGYSGPLMLQVTGASYLDEATGSTMSMATADTMSAVIDNVAAGQSQSGVWITPLTSMAQARAQAMSGGMTSANIGAANAALGRYFGVGDILHTAPMNPTVAGAGAAAGQDSRNHGVTLAAMSQYAKSLNMTSSAAMIGAMMDDASDGAMNGMKGGAQVSMRMGGMMGTGAMQANAGTSGLAAAMTGFMNSAANQSGLSAADMAALIQKLSNASGAIQ